MPGSWVQAEDEGIDYRAGNYAARNDAIDNTTRSGGKRRRKSDWLQMFMQALPQAQGKEFQAHELIFIR